MALYRRTVKRTFDLIGAGFALLILSPILAAVALAVRLRLGGPVLFSQERTGFAGLPFRIFKFRSMTDQRTASGALLPDEQRLTRFGRALRASSLDELPALINVVRGDMSLVGPRPLLHHYLERYDAFQLRRFEVRPGLTGWAVVNGRNVMSWKEKFEHDIWYVDHLSLGLDLKILVLTVRHLFDKSTVNAEGHATMPEFLGSHSALVGGEGETLDP